MVRMVIGYAILLIIGAVFYYAFLGALSATSMFASMEWFEELFSWFLILGVLTAMLIVIFVPIKVRLSYVNYRDRSFIKSAVAKWGYPKGPPSDLSAAAVSVLRGREVTSRTLGAIVIEMCTKGILRITPVARARGDPSGSGQEDEYEYRFTVRSGSNLDWERELCDVVQEREVTSERLKATLEDRRDSIGEKLGEYLRVRALFVRNPMTGFRWLHWLWWLGIVLMVSSSIAAAYAIAAADFAGASTGTVTVIFLILGLGPIGACYALVWWDFRPLQHLFKLADKPRPNARGFEELEKWLAFRQSMWREDPPTEGDEHSKPYPYLPYAFALGVDKPWMYSSIAETLFIDDTVTAADLVTASPSGSMFRPADGIFIGIMTADYVTGDAVRADVGIGGGGGDMDIDIDLSI